MSNRYRQLSKLASVIDALYEDAMHSPVMKKQALEDVRAGYLTKVAGKRHDDDVAFIDPRKGHRPFKDFETDEDDEDLDLTRLLEDSDELPLDEEDEEETDEEDLAEYLDEEHEAMEDFEYPPPPGRKFY